MATSIRGAGALVLALAVGCATLGSKPPGAPAGPEAPATEGTDAHGRPVRLSDQRGRVVLLSFWHSACPPCRALFPHERELARKYADRPFVLLGVNADESAGRLRQTEEKAGLTWASIHDGRGGPVCAAWGIEAFPTLVLVDAQGAVRWRQVGAPAEGVVEAKVEELLREVR